MLRRFALTAVALLATTSLVGCGGADRQYYDPHEGAGGADASVSADSGSATSGGSSGQGGASAGGTVGVGGDGGEGASPGDGGDAGSAIQDAAVDNYVPPPPVEPGRPGMDVVSWGAAMKSTNYKLVFTVGEGPGSNGMMVSPHYTMVTGLVGTTQP